MQIYRSTAFYLIIVEVLGTASVFFGMTVHQMSLQRAVSNYRCVEVDKTPHLGSSTCLVLF